MFVLAGGLHRAVHGKVGIHRPFGASTNARTYASTQESFRALEQTAKSFLRDMNVPTSLFDEMMSVPPQKLRILTEQELARFGIGQSDPSYQDNRDADAARALGLDREEYVWRSPDGRFKHLFLRLDLGCEPDGYPGILIVTDERCTQAVASAVTNLRKELPQLLKATSGTPVAYWWLEQDAQKRKDMLSQLTERPVFVG